MLHMPMETAVQGVRAVHGQLDTGMDRDTIHRLTLEALAQVPGARGVTTTQETGSFRMLNGLDGSWKWRATTSYILWTA